MSLVQPNRNKLVDYPESDGQPMGETDLHRDWMFRILELLRYRYRDQKVYVASNLLVYYEEGAPRRFVVSEELPRRTPSHISNLAGRKSPGCSIHLWSTH